MTLSSHIKKDFKSDAKKRGDGHPDIGTLTPSEHTQGEKLLQRIGKIMTLSLVVIYK